jgi:hypothetical protein
MRNTNPDGSVSTTIRVLKPEPTGTEMVSGGVSLNIGEDGLTTVTIRNTNPDGSVSTTIEVLKPEPTGTVIVSGGLSQNIGEDGLTTLTMRNTNPDGSVSTTIRVLHLESISRPTGYESQSESTIPEYETDAVYSEGLKVTFSMLSGLVAFFAI